MHKLITAFFAFIFLIILIGAGAYFFLFRSNTETAAGKNGKKTSTIEAKVESFVHKVEDAIAESRGEKPKHKKSQLEEFEPKKPYPGIPASRPFEIPLAKLHDLQNIGAKNVTVRGKGKVSWILPDDKKGAPHQRILLQINKKDTLLIAHNTTLAYRLENLEPGDEIEFCGEYEWTEKGGVIHWTHQDPSKKRPGGWLRYKGLIYE